ncbi:MAG: rRNA maturation RNase YbeY [Candidatus Sungiibacteriota bacterium]|uniref:Endoribonuclease YbeY n=1 Tax=Candidatus Sungiibacteriota bacterium TaxID=2750080 RepID=A0A7T5RJU4_9BACT|nr:MAG: rRNA maturation RNase YbeY [Candidatus Sungbacteria bacterium]
MVVLFRKFVNLLPESIRGKLPRKVVVEEISLQEAQRLNRLYRRKNKPANVLSFRYADDYGEILVCSAVIRREAKKQGNSYKYQMTWMIVHGMLHLAGLHHEKSKIIAERTKALEEKILKKVWLET